MERWLGKRSINLEKRESSARGAFAECPCCGGSVALAFINSHLDSGDCSRPKPNSSTEGYKPAAPSPPPSPPRSPLPPSQATAATARLSTTRKKREGETNALDVLTQAARTPKRAETFALWADAAGLLQWSWSLRLPTSADGPWQRVVAVKEKGMYRETELWLCTNLQPAADWDSRDELHIGNRHFTGLPVSNLKSILQKNVRRRRAVAAVRIALELARLDWTQFIRRVAVIMIEDGLLHPALPLVVFLMLADAKFHEEFPVPKIAIIAVLAIVEEMATTTLHDDHVYREPQDRVLSVETMGRRLADDLALRSSSASTLSTANTASSSSSSSSSSPLQSEEEQATTIEAFSKRVRSSSDDGPLCTILRCLAVRAQYGGMKGDVAMFYGCASIWLRRFAVGHGDPSCDVQVARNLLESSPSADSAATASVAEASNSRAAFWYCSDLFVQKLRVSSPWMKFALDAHIEPMASKIASTNAEHVPGRKRLEALLSNPPKAADAITAGLDFHVWPSVVSAIIAHLQASRDPEDQERARLLVSADAEELRSAMWCCSSGINFRRHLSTGIVQSSLLNQNSHFRDLWACMAAAHRKLATQRLSAFALSN